MVEPAHEGQGHAGALVAEVVARHRAAGETIIATCPYAQAWVRRHPDDAAGVIAPPS